MHPSKLREQVREVRRSRGRQQGFTLIELVAVMAILAILVAVVAPAVTNTQQASVRAQAQADSQQVNNAANDFFKDQNESEVRIPHTITTTATLSDGLGGAAAATDARQEVSTKWPEIYLTQGATPPTLPGRSASSKYAVVFQTDAQDAGAVLDAGDPVRTVTLLDQRGDDIDGAAFLADHTAIDLVTLVSGGYLASPPAAESRTSNTGIDTVEVPNFLWLFEKTDSSGGDNDARAIKVFQLVKVEQVEPASGATVQVDLTYQRIQ